MTELALLFIYMLGLMAATCVAGGLVMLWDLVIWPAISRPRMGRSYAMRRVRYWNL